MQSMEEVLAFTRAHYRDNRTTVSRDVEPLLRAAAEVAGLPLTCHRFATGAEYSTWVVPPRWDVNEAWLKGPDGRTVASYATHPLFVAPYSHAVHCRLSRDELLAHVKMHPSLANAFYYEHRLAYDYRRRLQEWLLTLPREVAERLPEGEYEVLLDVEVEPGEMLVGELTLPGRGRGRVALLTDYCHPGQVNDSMTGIAAGLELLRRLARSPTLDVDVVLYLFPETIGSSVFLSANPQLLSDIDVAIFCEAVGWGERWRVKRSRHEPSLANRIADDLALSFPGTELVGPFEPYGNDEIVFDYAGIPSLSVQKFPFREYHSSEDAPERIEPLELARAVDMLEHAIRTVDGDHTYAPVYPVPPYLSRFALYTDAVHERATFRVQRQILHAFSRARSLLDVASALSVPFATVQDFAGRLEAHGLLRRAPGTAAADAGARAAGAGDGPAR